MDDSLKWREMKICTSLMAEWKPFAYATAAAEGWKRKKFWRIIHRLGPTQRQEKKCFGYLPFLEPCSLSELYQ